MNYLYDNGFEVIAKVRNGNLCAYVPPCDSLRLTIERLQEDDPCWIKPRIRVMRAERMRLYGRQRGDIDFPRLTAEKTVTA